MIILNFWVYHRYLIEMFFGKSTGEKLRVVSRKGEFEVRKFRIFDVYYKQFHNSPSYIFN